MIDLLFFRIIMDSLRTMQTQAPEALTSETLSEIVIDGMPRIVDSTLTGSRVSDTLSGDRRSNAISGLGGDDNLFGLGGFDILDGGIGNDQLDGGSGSDRLFGGVGDDSLTGGSGNDTLYGTSGTDFATFDRDVLRGGRGDDILVGSGDVMYGGSGRDAFVIEGPSSPDPAALIPPPKAIRIKDFQDGLDRIGLPTMKFSDLTIVQRGANAHVRTGDRLLAIVENTSASSLTIADFGSVITAL
jgi:Ca2+-binding RTX toxin-like protein